MPEKRDVRDEMREAAKFINQCIPDAPHVLASRVLKHEAGKAARHHECLTCGRMWDEPDGVPHVDYEWHETIDEGSGSQRCEGEIIELIPRYRGDDD